MKTSQSIRSAQRWRTLVRLDKWIEPTMVALGLVWLVLLIVEFVRGLAPWMQTLSTAIWIAFIVEFVVRFTIAPRRGLFLARNWITLIALGLPALRILRFARALRLLRATRSLRLVRLLTSMNRGLRSLGAAMQQRGAGYVGVLTIVVALAAAAGMLAFENSGTARPFSSYGEALWWTAMLITTLGSEFWPRTPEGRILSLVLAVYAVGVFGYLAASLASYFVGKESKQASAAPDAAQIEALRYEMKMLRESLAAIRAR